MPSSLMPSILSSTKKVLGIDESYTAFDVDITMHINSVLATLFQLGIGPEEGFMIEDKSAAWDDFFDAESMPYLNMLKSYIYLRVRVLFDPPATSFSLDAMSKQITELEWRMSLYAPPTDYSKPTPGVSIAGLNT